MESYSSLYLGPRSVPHESHLGSHLVVIAKMLLKVSPGYFRSVYPFQRTCRCPGRIYKLYRSVRLLHVLLLTFSSRNHSFFHGTLASSISFFDLVVFRQLILQVYHVRNFLRRAQLALLLLQPGLEEFLLLLLLAKVLRYDLQLLLN